MNESAYFFFLSASPLPFSVVLWPKFPTIVSYGVMQRGDVHVSSSYYFSIVGIGT